MVYTYFNFTNNKEFITINFYSLICISINDAVENEILTRYLRKYHMISISYESSFSYFTNKKAFTNFY